MRVGGMPNELGMLFFIAMFAVWMEIGGRGNDEIRMTKDGGNPLPCPPPEYRERGSERVVRRVAAMGLLYAGVVLVHHHVMVVSALVLWVCLVWSILRGRRGVEEFIGGAGYRGGFGWVFSGAVFCACGEDHFDACVL